MYAIKYINSLRPKVKWCYWCKNHRPCMLDLLGEAHPSWICKSHEIKLTRRQHNKFLKEKEFRYCKNYRFSKKRFYNWKNEIKNNEEDI